MARKTRLKFEHADDGYYHIISRTVLQNFLLQDLEKEIFCKLLRKLSQVYFVEIATFSIMSNHIHLILKMVDPDLISSEEMKHRYDRYYNHNKYGTKKKPYPITEAEWNHYRDRWSDISCFMQDLKQRFSRWYNRRHQSSGHVWSDRFKSVLLATRKALLACMAYVDLNSVRAGIVPCPEDYRFCGLTFMVLGGKHAAWLNKHALSDAIIKHDEARTHPELVRQYLDVVYEAGLIEKDGKGCITGEKYESRERSNQKATAVHLRRRIRYFTEGVALGSEEFCQELIFKFQNIFQRKKVILPIPISRPDIPQIWGLERVYSVRKIPI
ncbi:transposase [candidate division CSSED10-310 bacterium]|uniref:Transposase n=1 Tax=candidate division CSSED10-310 bacterium TaxID=2855610 RepID=A0ABV6Z3R5_UNCC1